MNPEPSHAQQNVCILRLSAIGDTCHTLPVVRTLMAAWPQARFTWVIGKIEATLLGDIPDIEFIIFDKSKGLGAYRELRQILSGRRFDVLLHMHPSMRANLVSLMIKAPVRLGFDRARARDYQWLFTNQKISPRARQHVMDGLFEFAEHMGVSRRTLRWDIPLSEDDRRFAAAHVAGSRPVLVISPCSNQRFRNVRNWNAEGYAAIADFAAERFGAKVLITGGGSALEREYADAIGRRARCETLNLVGKTSLKQLLALLEAASVLVCPDSGPAHMATTVGTPVVGLYAATNPMRAGPYLSRDLVVDKYPAAVARAFGKAVDDMPWGARVHDPDAMSLISVEEVTAKLETVLGGQKRQPVK